MNFKKSISIGFAIIFIQMIAGLAFIPKKTAFKPKLYLSEYQFFVGPISNLKPKKSVVLYDLKNGLFSDFAKKLRFIQLPAGHKIDVDDSLNFDFPDGTKIIKNFYFDNDSAKPEIGRRIMETRLLVKENGNWQAYEYIWNETQTDAELEVAGGETQVEYTNEKGKKVKQKYIFPNQNQCKSCHNESQKLVPIGFEAKYLNQSYDYSGKIINQLDYLNEVGLFNHYQKSAKIPQMAVWNEKNSGTVNERARAYLDINCSYCHQKNRPAETSGLYLNIEETDKFKWGYLKSPVAAGRASAKNNFDIEPGKPEKSVLLYRMTSLDPGIMMPEVGRTQVHHEAVELIKDWIKNLE